MVIIELADKSVVIKDEKLNVIMVSEDVIADVGTILDEIVVVPVTINEAEE